MNSIQGAAASPAPPAPLPLPLPSPSPVATLARSLALTPAEKLNLILHQTLLVLSFLRRNAKFSATPMPHLCPSPYAGANAQIVATLDSSAIGAHHAASSPASAPGQDGPGASSVNSSGAQSTSVNGSRERDDYLDRCARLFAWAGQPPAVRVSTPISHSPSMDEDALLSAAVTGGNTHLSIHVETAAMNNGTSDRDDDDQASIDATSLIQSVAAQPAAAAESAPLLASAAAAADLPEQPTTSSAATTVPPSPEPGQSAATKKPTPQPTQHQSHHIALPCNRPDPRI
ncbi:hypothetical protein BCR44DRAFT_1142503 [Catenaria anguillulae PL171]|uniref:Uncharacterized protein n=1 Tax=Catenaria anguillulae PL171 TaxID=765915 RepID=A0A1Y2HJF5_9FUNG|nr:hypothetical protein BCR44DRAFT_1142503 [Catenaria anguillulae PL171]